MAQNNNDLPSNYFLTADFPREEKFGPPHTTPPTPSL